MAKIPTGDFGQSIAQPQRAVGAPDLSAPARATAQLGQALGDVATDQIAAQTRLDLQRKDMEERTTYARTRVTTTNDLADLQDTVNRGVLDGTIPKDKAAEEWDARASDLLANRTDGLAPQYAAELTVQMEDLRRRGLNGVRDAVSRRDLQDTRANIDALGEEYGRMATRDRPDAIAGYAAVLQTEPDPERRQAKMQAFKESTAYTNAFTMVRDSSRNLAQVKAARDRLATDEFADVDPQRRAALHAQLDGYETSILQRQEIAAQRAERKRDAHLREAKAAYETAQGLIDGGVPLAPEEVTRLSTVMQGTPYLAGLQRLQQSALQVGGFGAQTVGAQQAALDRVRSEIAQNGATEALVKRREQLERVVGATTRAIADDPLRAGLERGVITELAPLNMGGGVNGLVASLGQRLQSARTVSAWAQQPVSPLTSDEATQVGKMISMLPIDQRAGAIAAISTAIGPQGSAGLAKQIDKSDKALALAFQYGAAKTTRDRYVSEIILRGADALKSKSVKVDPAAESGWKATIAREIGDAYPVPALRDDVREAAFLITAGRAAEEGAVDPKHAVRLAARGGIVEVNGAKIPVDGQVDEGDVERRLQTLTADDLKPQVPGGKVRIGGQVVPLDQFVSGLPGAQLSYAGRPNGGATRYHILAGGRYATDESGRRLTITVQPNAR